MNSVSSPAPHAPAELTAVPMLPYETPTPEPLGTRMMKGATWILIQSIIAQALAFGCKIAIARLLTKSEVGVATLALSICSFFSFLQPSALSDILIQRQRHFTRWANSAFWMSAALVSLMLVSAVIAAPIAGFYFHNASIAPMVVIGVLPAVFAGLTVVWSAQVSISFNFRSAAIIGSVSSICITVLTVTLAAMKAGPWALVVPTAVAALISLGLYSRIAPFRPHGRPHFRRWRFLLGDSVVLSVGAFFANLAMQADNFFIGVYQSDAALGVYAIAYSASFQFVQLSTRSLRGVILPAFSSFGENTQRREAAFLNAVQMVSLIVFPVCVLMIPAAPAAMRLVFSSQWDESAPLMQIFLSGMAFVVLGGLATSVMQARRMFVYFVVTNAVVGLTFCAVVWISAAFSGTKAVAIGATLVYAISGVIGPLAASAPSSAATKGRLLAAMLVPFAIAGASALAGWGVCQLTPWVPLDLRYGILAGLTGYAVYILLATLFMRDTVKLAMERVRAMLRRRQSTKVESDAV